MSQALALAAAVLAWAGPARVAAQALELRPSPRLQESLSPQERSASVTHIEADQIRLRPDLDLQLEGDVRLRRAGTVIRAQRITLDQVRDRLQASGGVQEGGSGQTQGQVQGQTQGLVQIQRLGNRFEGPLLQLQLDSFVGQFQSPSYQLAQGGHGQAQRLDFLDEERMQAQQARYTTCRRTPGPEWLPEWFLQAGTLSTDEVEQSGQAQQVQLHFLGLSTPTLPSLSFGLSSQRQSGLLAPVVGVDTVNGIDISQPYYWNIAPHRDATLTPRFMSQRGLATEGEFRYLEGEHQGQARLNWMADDRLRQRQRWGLSAQHSGPIEVGSASPLALALSLNRVSDDDYWRDFPRSGSASTSALTQRLLPSNAQLSWSQDRVSMQLRLQKWQTLQDVASSAYIKPPYDKAPQLSLHYGDWRSLGGQWSTDWGVNADTTRFEADFSRLPVNFGQAHNGQRSYVQAHISPSWRAPWGFVSPKLQLHASRYELQTALSDGNITHNRVLPTLSLDSGLTFERETSAWGRSLTQTLEPRLFYVRTPYRDQSMLPLYDTGLTDFSFTTIYNDNPYVGQDRIVDNNALTLGLSSRLFDSQSGAELLRLGLAQRVRFADQRVNLGSTPAAVADGDSKGLSDVLLGASTQWSNAWALDSVLQFNADNHEVQRSTLQARYHPSPYRLLSLAYRQNRGSSDTQTSPSQLIDLGWQWPLSDWRMGNKPDDSGVRAGGQGLGEQRWYGVGRMNYSLQDRRLVDTLIGLEFDAGCWIGRMAFERLQSTLSSATTRIMFQLELVGFGRVGVSPLDSLKRHIPRYQYLREHPSNSSRFLNYD